MLIIQIEHSGKQETHRHLNGPVVIGRVPQGPERFIQVLDQYVSGRHILLHEQPNDRVLIENLGRNAVRLPDGRCLDQGDSSEEPMPIELKLPSTVVSIESPTVPRDGNNVYNTLPRHDGSVTRLNALQDAPSADQLTSWLETLLSVQQSAVGSEKFYEETAQALVDLIGMDRGLVLLRERGEWTVAAARSKRGEQRPSYSKSILAKVLAEASTVTRHPRGADAANASTNLSASLIILEAAVGSPIFDDAGEVVGVLYGSRDFVHQQPSTAIRPIEAQLVQLLAHSITTGLHRMAMLDRLRQAEQLAAVGQALGYILHDLRGPLGNAQQLTEMLRRPESAGTLSREQQLDYIDESLAISLDLLNDSLEFCRGNVQLEPVHGNCRPLLEKYIRLLEMKLQSLRVKLEVDIPDQLPVVLDPARIARVIYNIAKNGAEALNGRPDGKVTLTARRLEDDRLSLAIADNGGGLPQAVKETLFQPFGTHGKRGGTGFGLAIAKQLVDAHQGEIQVDSGPTGTTFTITIPPEIVAAPETKVAAEAELDTSTDQPKAESRTLRVLLAEDGRVHQALIGGRLREHGCTVKVVGNGALAIAEWESTAFDLILMDVEMPEMDGLEATRIIREREGNAERRTPIIALTAHETDDIRDKCRDSGMDDFLEKPPTGDSLSRLLDQHR